MDYPTTVQLISHEKTEQGYVNFPAAVARALDFEKGEVVEWTCCSTEPGRLKSRLSWSNLAKNRSKKSMFST